MSIKIKDQHSGPLYVSSEGVFGDHTKGARLVVLLPAADQ